MSDNESVLGGGGYPAFTWLKDGDDPPGPVLKGQIIEEKRKQDWWEGKPLTWDDGSPKYVWILAVDTHDPDQGENGIVSAWIRGNAVKVLREAAKAGGIRRLTGSEITMQLYAKAEKKGGKRPANLFKAKLIPGELPVTTPADPFNDDEEPF
jgi:hypothetical protein